MSLVVALELERVNVIIVKKNEQENECKLLKSEKGKRKGLLILMI